MTQEELRNRSGDGPAPVSLTTGRTGTGRVRGTVRGPDGQPAVAAKVTVVARRLRQTDAVLATADAGVDGSYVAKYSSPSGSVDLVIRAAHGDASTESPMIVGAGPDERVDLVLGGAYVGPSDLMRLETTITPALGEAGGATIADLTEAELALIAAKSGAEPAALVLLHQAAALAARTRLSTVLFYALGRQRIPLSWPSIIATAPDKRRNAIARAMASNQVPPSLAKQLDGELARLDQLVIAEALREPEGKGESSLGSLLGAAGMSADQRAKLVALYVKRAGDTAAFWKDARGILGAGEVATLQDTLRVGAMTLGHVPLVVALRARKLTTPADLAKLERADWQALVTAVGVPPDLAAGGLTVDAYVELLVAIVEDVVPTARVTARVAHLPGGATLAEFFTKNPTYDLRTPAAAFLRAHPDALAFLPDDAARATFTGQLHQVERLYRIAPGGARLVVMEALLAAGVDSAQAIRAMGRARFLSRFGATLGHDVARRTYARASHAVATATTLLGRYGAAFDGATPSVLPRRAEGVTSLPDYATLFGNVDSCACSACRSMTSPAAYLTDVLHWLDGKDALDLVLDRRADLGTIELSCPNTNTAFPQIDLVNELLELAVAPPEASPAYQTRGAAEDLRVQPEHQHDPAYEVLAGAVYPFGLPYALALDEARTYLGQLGVGRSVLMEVFHDGGRDAALADPAVAVEALGMSPLEWDVIASKPLDPPRSAAAMWGLDGDPHWPTSLATVSTLLDRSGAEFAELEDWLRTDFVQAAGPLGLQFQGASCDLDHASQWR